MKDEKDKWAKDLNEQMVWEVEGVDEKVSRAQSETGWEVSSLYRDTCRVSPLQRNPSGEFPIWGKSQSDTCTHTVVFGVIWVLADHDVSCFFVFKSPNLVSFGSNTEGMWYKVIIIRLPFLIKFLVWVKDMIYYVSDDSLSSLLYFPPRCHCLLATSAT